MLTDHQMEDMYQLVRDNNHMLHAQRKTALIGTFFKVIFYIVFIILPLLYSIKYLAPMLAPALKMAQQMQGGTSTSQIDMAKFGDYMKQLESMLPSIGTSTKK